jgi:uncharacterized protein (DUF58 family)
MDWRRFIRSNTPAAIAPYAHEALLSADDIAELALQAALLNEVRAEREVHDHHVGDWPSAWFGRGLDYEESRPYAAGDDIRDMDWRTTARTGRPFLKIYREEHQPVLHLVADRSASLRFATRRRLKAAQAARVAVLLAFAAAQANSAVGATLWDDLDLDLPPRHGHAGALALAEAASVACPPSRAANPTEPLRDLDRLAWLDANLPRGARLVLASDFAWLDARHETALSRLADRLDVLAVVITDPAEHALPDVGLACFQGMDSLERAWLDTRRPGVRQAIAAGLEARLAQRAEILARAGIRLLAIGCEVDDLLPLLSNHA